MTTEEKKEQEGASAKKEPYEPPAVISEEVFETLALGCGGSSPVCQLNGTFAS